MANGTSSVALPDAEGVVGEEPRPPAAARLGVDEHGVHRERVDLPLPPVAPPPAHPVDAGASRLSMRPSAPRFAGPRAHGHEVAPVAPVHRRTRGRGVRQRRCARAARRAGRAAPPGAAPEGPRRPPRAGRTRAAPPAPRSESSGPASCARCGAASGRRGAAHRRPRGAARRPAPCPPAGALPPPPPRETARSTAPRPGTRGRCGPRGG